MDRAREGRKSALNTRQISELRQAPLFAQAADEHLAVLGNIMQDARLAASDTLFTHGQPAERFFFLRTDQIKLFRISPDGHEKIIEIMQVPCAERSSALRNVFQLILPFQPASAKAPKAPSADASVGVATPV